jgi:hypothetical protein
LSCTLFTHFPPTFSCQRFTSAPNGASFSATAASAARQALPVLREKINMNDELFDDINREQSLPEQYLGLSWPKLIFAVLLIVALGVYIGVLLFGDNSLQVLLELEEYEAYLKEDIERLKTENASMQKEYFELKELDADTSGK